MGNILFDSVPDDLITLVVRGYLDDLDRTVLAHVNNQAAEYVCETLARDDVCSGAVSADVSHTDSFSLLMWAISAGYPYIVPISTVVISGNIAIMDWLHSRDEQWSDDLIYTAFYAAAVRGQIGMIEWLCEKGYNPPTDTITIASRKGHLSVVEWLHTTLKHPLDSLMENTGNNVELADWLHKNGECIDYNSMYCTARDGHLDVLKWMFSKLNPADVHDILRLKMLRSAAENGHFDTILFLYETGFVIGDDIIIHAARSGNLELVQWLYENHGWDSRAGDQAAMRGHIEIIKWAYSLGLQLDIEDIVLTATYDDRIDILEWIHTEVRPMKKHDIDEIINLGALSAVQWLISKGYQWRTIDSTNVATSDMSRTMIWLIENGYPYDLDECIIAARNNHFGGTNVLNCLHEHGISLDRPRVRADAYARVDAIFISLLDDETARADPPDTTQ